MPAVILGRDWATGTVGTRVKLAANVSGYAALTAEVAEKERTLTAYSASIDRITGAAA